MQALLTGEEAVGALVKWVLGGHGVLPVLPLVLLGLGHHRQQYVSGASLKHLPFRLLLGHR